MPATTRLIPLGTNGFYPSHGRHTMSYLLLAGGNALLLDAGSGVGRFAEPDIAAELAGIDRLEILLTHYHLDHVIGLSYLPGVWRGRPARIWAPASPLVEGSPEGLRRLLSPPLFPTPLADFPLPIEVVEMSAAPPTLAGFPLRVRRQEHPGASIGVRLGDTLAYVTDTVIDEATVDFARGVRTLLHETWLTESEVAAGAYIAGHSTAEGAVELARRAGVGRLVPIHHHPTRSPAQLAELWTDLASSSCLEILLPTEGQPIPLD